MAAVLDDLSMESIREAALRRNHELWMGCRASSGRAEINALSFRLAAGSGIAHIIAREFALILFAIGIALTIQIATGGLLPMARYTITVGSLLAIASGYGLERMPNSRSRPRQFRVAVGLLLVVNLAAILAISEVRSSVSDK